MAASHSHPTNVNVSLPVSRAEWGWLGFALVAGAVLRLGTLSEVAVEHFDEAVYASNLLFTADEGGEFPMRPLYAPPLLPAAMEWTTIFGQLAFRELPSWWPMLPALAAGLATIASVWWIARRWFSPSAGIIAALVMAFHEYHAAYSRTALTDVPLSLFVLWAVHWFWNALRSGKAADAVLAGVFTALAWWTKYNGWLPLAIAMAGGVWQQILTPMGQRNWARLGWVWIIGAATAFALWSPVLWDCRRVGGYAKVAENHRGYFTGISKWGENLLTGYGLFDEFVGGLSLVGLILAAIVIAVSREQMADHAEARPTPQIQSDDHLAHCLLGAWFWGLLAATPMYHPYSRLWLPWLVASVLLMASVAPVHRRNPWPLLATWYRRSLVAAAAGCALLFVAAAIPWSSSVAMPSCFESRASMRKAAREIRQFVNRDEAVYLVGSSDPALWYQLRTMGSPAALASFFETTGGNSNSPRYLVLGPMSQREPALAQEFKRQRGLLVPVAEFLIHPSRIETLDLFTPAQLAGHPERRDMTVRLYRFEK